jgi:hypothetical protein
MQHQVNQRVWGRCRVGLHQLIPDERGWSVLHLVDRRAGEERYLHAARVLGRLCKGGVCVVQGHVEVHSACRPKWYFMDHHATRPSYNGSGSTVPGRVVIGHLDRTEHRGPFRLHYGQIDTLTE